MSAQALWQALPIACALLLVRVLAAEAVHQRAVRTKAGLRFPIGLGLRVTFRLGGPFLLFVAYKMSQEAKSSIDYAAALAVAVLGCGCVFGEPGPITVSQHGVVQASMLGMLRRRIAWQGATASAPTGSREVLVIGSDGSTITHSQYHVGQDEFISELERHDLYIQGRGRR